MHKKGRAKQAEREAALGELDRHTAQKLALKREVERVQERMHGIYPDPDPNPNPDPSPNMKP